MRHGRPGCGGSHLRGANAPSESSSSHADVKEHAPPAEAISHTAQPGCKAGPGSAINTATPLHRRSQRPPGEDTKCLSCSTHPRQARPIRHKGALEQGLERR